MGRTNFDKIEPQLFRHSAWPSPNRGSYHVVQVRCSACSTRHTGQYVICVACIELRNFRPTCADRQAQLRKQYRLTFDKEVQLYLIGKSWPLLFWQKNKRGSFLPETKRQFFTKFAPIMCTRNCISKLKWHLALSSDSVFAKSWKTRYACRSGVAFFSCWAVSWPNHQSYLRLLDKDCFPMIWGVQASLFCSYPQTEFCLLQNSGPVFSRAQKSVKTQKDSETCGRQNCVFTHFGFDRRPF